MRLRATPIALMLAAAATAAIASPQAEMSTGSIIQSPQAASIPDGGAHDTEAALKVMRTFGECAAKDRQLSKRLLAAVPMSPEEQSAAVWMSKSSCLNGGMLHFRTNLLRGIVAEYTLSKMTKATSGDWASIPIFPVPDAAALAQAVAGRRTEVVLIDFGQCVATAAMPQVRALLATRPNTPSESSAFSALGPNLGGCAERGVSVKLNRFQLRGYLAEGAYRAMVTQSKEAGRAQG